MRAKVLNYRILITPDKETGTGKPGYTAISPTLGVADDGDTIEKALSNVRGAIKAYIESLAEVEQPVPVDQPEKDIVTTTQVSVSPRLRFA